MLPYTRIAPYFNVIFTHSVIKNEEKQIKINIFIKNIFKKIVTNIIMNISFDNFEEYLLDYDKFDCYIGKHHNFAPYFYGIPGKEHYLFSIYIKSL